MRTLLTVAIFFASTALLQAQSVEYTIEDLGVVPERESVFAASLNDDGVVVGECRDNGPADSKAFFFQEAIEEIGLGAENAKAINNQGEIVGYANGRIFYYYDGSLEVLDHIFDGNRSVAEGINDSGIIVGSANLADGSWRAFCVGCIDTDLGTLGGEESRAYGVNNVGQIVGSAENEAGDTHAFLMTDGEMTDLGTLGTASTATDVNDEGIVVGTSFAQLSEDPPQWAWRAFVHDGAEMKDLGTLGGAWAKAAALNSDGDIVGQSSLEEGGYHAVIWRDGLIQDLNDLISSDEGWTLMHAADINESGQIAGWGQLAGETRAFLLTPVPATSVKPACAEDINADGMVDFSDLLEVLAAWGSCVDCAADVTGDGEVDLRDLLVLLSGWGVCD